MKKILLFFVAVFMVTLVNGQILYNADFSTDGQGFVHTTSNSPASGPASANGGLAPNNWVASYTTTPATDGSDNEFITESGVFRIQDFGGTGTWQSVSIDISTAATIDINASGGLVGSDVQNGSGEFFEYFYILDGGSEVKTSYVEQSDGNINMNYSISGLDVSANNSIIIGFRANVNGGGDGYSISSFTVNQITVVPVELTTFTATPNQQTIDLTWATATEENNAYFEVQSSVDGKNFETIGQVEGAGTTYEVQAYTFVDENPANGVNYYRLRQVDFDGGFEYHQVVSVEMKGDRKEVQVYPNPTRGELNIVLPTTSESEIQVIDLTGKILRTVNSANDDLTTLNIADLPNGQYMLRIKNEQTISTTLFIKTK